MKIVFIITIAFKNAQKAIKLDNLRNVGLFEGYAFVIHGKCLISLYDLKFKHMFCTEKLASNIDCCNDPRNSKFLIIKTDDLFYVYRVVNGKLVKVYEDDINNVDNMMIEMAGFIYERKIK
jgi:hypothetical protein